MSQPYLF